MPRSGSPSASTSPLEKTTSQSSDYFDDDPEFSNALATLDDSLLFGSQPLVCIDNISDSCDEVRDLSEIRSSSQDRKRKHSLTLAPGPENFQEEPGTSSSGPDQQTSTLQPTTSVISTLAWNSIIGPVTPAKTQDTYHASKFSEFGDYFRRKRAKLQNQNADLSTQDNRPSQGSIFKSLAIYITGRTVPSLQILRSLILQHGGQFHAYLDRKEMVTHVITSNLTPAKALEFKNMRVVRPEWLLDSLAANKLLPWTDYRWSENHQPSSPIHNATLGTPILTPSIRPPRSSLKHADMLAIALDSPLKKQSNNPKESLPPFLSVLPSGDMAEKSSQEAQATNPDLSNFSSSEQAGTSDLRLMESAEWREAHTSASGETFIQGYYQHSRLHHLSKWKSELRILVAKAQENAESQISLGGMPVASNSAHINLEATRGKGKSRATERVVMHCDFDSFFVSAGLVARPELQGKPVVVCHSSGKGIAHSTSEVASASYAARAFGVKNGMSLGQAKKLCPEIQTIPYEFERLATKRAKPAGSFYLSAEDAPAHIADLDIVNIHGFAGAVRDKAIIHLGTSRLGDLAKHSKATLQRALGDKSGERIWNAIRGIDDRALESDKPRKSVSADVNYGIRFQSNKHAESFVHGLAKEVSERLRSVNKVGRSLTKAGRESGTPSEALTIGPWKFMGHGKCETFSKTCSISGPRGLATNDPDIIGREAWKLLHSMHFDPTELRGIGIQIQKLDETEKLTGAGVVVHGQLAKRFQHVLAKGNAGKQKDSTKATREGPLQKPDLSVIDVDILDGGSSNVAPGCKETPYDLTGPTQVNSKNETPATSPQALPSVIPIAGQPTSTGRTDAARKCSIWAQPRALGADVTVIDVDALETQRPAPGAKGLPYDLTMLSQLDQETLVDMMGGRLAALPPIPNTGLYRLGRLKFVDASRTWDHQPVYPIHPNISRFSNINLRQFRIRNSAPTSIPDPSKYFPIFKHQFAPIPDQELVALGIDPIAYANMPRDRQKALVSTRRAAKGLDGNGRPILQRKRRFIEDGDKPVHHVILAGRTELPALRAAAPGIPAVTETSDIQDMIRLWVETKVAKKLGPDPREVAHFGGFLERSMATDSGMQRSVEVMKWWKDVCMKNWGIEQERRGQYGREWWVAWWQVKDKLDAIVKKRFGGKLNLD
ncbi:hypothetical protein RSAG8_07629, partial [Rhizoctonia solani AG-8 WAC10335]